MPSPRPVTTASQTGLLIALGVIAALVVLSFVGPDPSSSIPNAAGVSTPIEGREDAAARSASNANQPNQPPALTTDEELVHPAANLGLASSMPPPIDQASTIESSAAAVAAAPLSSARDQTEPGSGEHDPTERPLGWCFRSWLGWAEPWRAVVPPGEHGLKSDSRVVWNGARSAWLGTEAPYGASLYIDIMWQTIDAAPYRGSWIELSAQFRGRHPHVHLFLRTTQAMERELVMWGSGSRATLVFDSDDSWRRWAVVGDVPIDADVIVFGVAVYNRGHVWIDDVRLTGVSTSTRLTDNPIGAEAQELAIPLPDIRPFDVPTNLDFEATDLDSAGLPLEPASC